MHSLADVFLLAPLASEPASGSVSRLTMNQPFLAASLLSLWASWLPAQLRWDPVPVLSNRSSHASAYDAERGFVILFGGMHGLDTGDPSGEPVGDTWAYTGTSWLRLSPRTSPPPRYGHRMVYDSARRRVVMAGGASQAPDVDTYEYDGTTWRAIATAPNRQNRRRRSFSRFIFPLLRRFRLRFEPAFRVAERRR